MQIKIMPLQVTKVRIPVNRYAKWNNIDGKVELISQGQVTYRHITLTEKIDLVGRPCYAGYDREDDTLYISYVKSVEG